MVYIPGGEFLMGNNSGDEYEKPAHRVTVKPFFIDRYEVTCEEYERYVKATGHKPPANWVNGTCPRGAARLPVTGVDWDDANTYLLWAKRRLPTEEEWEFAARGSEGWTYPWGNDWQPGLANANNPSQGLAEVGRFKGRSPFGIADMVGNAWEWTGNPIHSYSGGKIAEDTLAEVDRNKMKTIRGGCFISRPNQATTTYRRGWPPLNGPYEFDQTGFRGALDAPNKN
jgi:serine/threonine-protein kinase